MGIALFIVSEALFFLGIFWAYYHRVMWIETKLRGHPKALITKLFEETLKVALLMIKGIVTSLEIIGANQWMGNRGSKSDSHISVKEQRVDGFSISSRYCKVYSMCQGNLVIMHNNIKGLFKDNTLQKTYFIRLKLFKPYFYSNTQRSLFSSKPMLPKLNPYYVTGFSDGEGCFYLAVSPNTKYKTGFRVKASFQIGVHIRDLALLEQIKLFFAVGQISKLGPESVQYRVSALEDLRVIVNHFEIFSLITYKKYDYLLFKQALELIAQGKHLTLHGLNQIVSIKASLNSKKISEELKLTFSDIVPTLIPEAIDKKIESLHWLAGFTDGEGCFFIALKKSLQYKLGETVWLRFILTQHVKDKNLLESLIYTLNCGRYIPKSGYGEFIVEKFTDIDKKVIPIFEQFKLHGVKSDNFEDFKKVALMMGNKHHLTRKGLDEIKKIKGKMNKNRKY